MIYGLKSRDSLCIYSNGVACIHISVESRKVTAGNVYADTMPLSEQLTDGTKPDDYPHYFPGF